MSLLFFPNHDDKVIFPRGGMVDWFQHIYGLHPASVTESSLLMD